MDGDTIPLLVFSFKLNFVVVVVIITIIIRDLLFVRIN